MTPTARIGLGVALATIAIVAMLLGVLARPDANRQAPATEPTPAHAQDVGDPGVGRAPPGEPVARQVARRFLIAFADYEVGATTPRVRHRITATSTPPLAASLLDHPPRSVPGPPPARHAVIAELVLAGVTADGWLHYRTQLQRGAVTEAFSLLVASAQGAWRVARVSG